MKKYLIVAVVTTVMLTGCAQPREHSSVDVTPPPIVEVPTQTVYHQALRTVMDVDAIISTGSAAHQMLESAGKELEKFSPEPEECSGIVDPELYSTTQMAIGFQSETTEETHESLTIGAIEFDTAELATEYFNARTDAWQNCATVDLTIDETNVLTLAYSAQPLADTEAITNAEILLEADQDLLLSSNGELSADLQRDDVEIPDPGILPDYVISPDDVPEPETQNIAVTSGTIITRFEHEVLWVQTDPGDNINQAIEDLAQLHTAIQEGR